jgi:hypothetical protein
MTIKEMKRFCAHHGQHEFLNEPFRLAGQKNNLVIASDGSSLLAVEVANNAIPLTLSVVNGSNAEKITKWLSVEIPDTKYSTEDLDNFLKPNSEREEADPISFGGYRIDRVKLRSVFTLADEPYRYMITDDGHGHRFCFKFSRYTALIMGMRDARDSDPKYTPKVIK